MRRVIATVVGTVIGLVLLLSFKTHPLSSSALATPPAAVTPAQPSASAGPSAGGSAAPPSAGASNFVGELSPAGPSASAAPAPSTAAKPAPTTSKATTGKQTVTGEAADTRYGPVQVQITVSGGKVTAATVTQVPQESRRDIEINSYAVPILDQEAVQAGSAQIDMVSGATFTSMGYQQSLQSALDKAGMKG